VVLNSSNQIVSAIDYDCWGYPLENRSYQSDNIDYKFTGKQRDAETGYDYFGARYYDARIGRWGGVEPLLEKYISYSPYQYGLLNPMRLVDANGMDVRATTAEAQQMILNTLPKDIRSSIIFNEGGNIDKEVINKIESKSGNFEALKQLVNDSRLYNVSISNEYTYMDESGNTATKSFGNVSIGDKDEVSEMGPRTMEVGMLGVTLAPGKISGATNSPDESIYILINSALSSEGKAQVFSHEAFGHAFLFSLGGGSWRHDPSDDMVEMNDRLYNQIVKSINETILNMEEK